jgi:ADP-heptose:LPS heptosyltransferase
MRRYAVTRRWTQWALAALDGVGGRVWPRRAARADPMRRILILRRERLGDLITMLPAIERARALYPAAAFTWMVAPAYAGFVRQWGVADEVWAVGAWWRAALARRRHFDLALEFHADARWVMVARRQARRVAGYGIRGGAFWLDHEVEFPAWLSASGRNVWLVEQAAGAPARRAWAPQLRPRAAWLKTAKGWDARGSVLVHPGCGQPSKRWPESYWRQLITRVRERGWRVVLVGGPNDVELCRSLSAATSVPTTAGQTRWEALAGMVAEAATVVAPDTGVVHLAHALGTPAVALFGPTDPAVWGYREAGYAALTQRLPCSHCDRGRCPRVARGTISPCLEAITPERVLVALEEVLGQACGAEAANSSAAASTC